MPNLRSTALFVLFALFSSPGFTEIRVEDDLGHQIVLEAPAKRIIALAPHLVEQLYSLDKGENIVGAVEYSDFPEAAKNIPRIGNYQSFSVESALRMKPDLVVAWKHSGGQNALNQLRKLGIPVYISAPKNIEQIGRTLSRLGILTGAENAKSLKADFDNGFASLRQEYSQKEPISLFYQVWNTPLQTLNDKHFMGEIIKVCGGKNIFGDLPTLAPVVSHESVIRENPQAIVLGNITPDGKQWLEEWQQWQTISAVRHQQTIQINPDLLHRHTLRVLEGAKELCTKLDASRSYYQASNAHKSLH